MPRLTASRSPSKRKFKVPRKDAQWTSSSLPSRIKFTGLNRSGCGLRRLHALLRSRSDSTSSGSPEISLEIRRVPRHGLAETAIAPSGRPWTSGAKGCNAPTRHVEQSLVTQISGDGEPVFNTMANRCIH
jgi:hypothetical protein